MKKYLFQDISGLKIFHQKFIFTRTFFSCLESLMNLTGQSTTSKSNQGLSRLNINYDVETEDGQTLTRGDWKMMYEGEMVYAKSVLIRPILRTYEWSVFDPELGNFKCKSVQKPTMSGDFPDTEGGNKCGRLSPQEEYHPPRFKAL